MRARGEIERRHARGAEGRAVPTRRREIRDTRYDRARLFRVRSPTHDPLPVLREIAHRPEGMAENPAGDADPDDELVGFPRVVVARDEEAPQHGAHGEREVDLHQEQPRQVSAQEKKEQDRVVAVLGEVLPRPGQASHEPRDESSDEAEPEAKTTTPPTRLMERARRSNPAFEVHLSVNPANLPAHSCNSISKVPTRIRSRTTVREKLHAGPPSSHACTPPPAVPARDTHARYAGGILRGVTTSGAREDDEARARFAAGIVGSRDGKKRIR